MKELKNLNDLATALNYINNCEERKEIDIFRVEFINFYIILIFDPENSGFLLNYIKINKDPSTQNIVNKCSGSSEVLNFNYLIIKLFNLAIPYNIEPKTLIAAMKVIYFNIINRNYNIFDFDSLELQDIINLINIIKSDE